MHTEHRKTLEKNFYSQLIYSFFPDIFTFAFLGLSDK